jgi:hypothetical protein
MTKFNFINKYEKYFLFLYLAFSPYIIYEINNKFEDIRTFNNIEKDTQRELFDIQKTSANITTKKLIEYSCTYAKIVGIITYIDIDNKNHTSEEVDLYNPGENSYGKTLNVMNRYKNNIIDIWYKRNESDDFHFNEIELFDTSTFYNSGYNSAGLIAGIVIFSVILFFVLYRICKKQTKNVC